MIFKGTKLIAEEMDKQDIAYEINEDNDFSSVVSGFYIDNGPAVDIQFTSFDEDNFVSIRAFGIIHGISEKKKTSILKTLNQLNNEYNFLSFYIDDDGDIDVGYDISENTPDNAVGIIAIDIFYSFMSILNEAYPKLMKAMWK